jgi:hypothetical protein
VLNCNRDQIDVTDIYKIFHTITSEYIFFSAAHGTFSKIDILDHKASLKNKTNSIIFWTRS